MKGAKIRVAFIYFLILVLIGLVCYLIYFTVNQSHEIKKAEEEKNITKQKEEEITDACTFDTTVVQFNGLATNPTSLSLCSGYNKINLTGIVLNDDIVNVSAVYYNGTITETKSKLGLYMNDKQITIGASYDVTNTLGVFENLLFIKRESSEDSNVLAFNIEGKKVYDFKVALAKAQIEDPVFTELAKIDDSVSTKVLIGSVDENSYNFTNGSFTFNTGKNTCTEGQTYKGSTYRVTYTGETFADPVFVSNVNC